MAVKFVITKTGMFIGEVISTVGKKKIQINKPMQVSYQQLGPNQLSVGVSPYPPGVKDLVDDLENHSISFHMDDVMCMAVPADKLKDEWTKGSNMYRNIAVPTTGQIIDVGATK